MTQRRGKGGVKGATARGAPEEPYTKNYCTFPHMENVGKKKGE